MDAPPPSPRAAIQADPTPRRGRVRVSWRRSRTVTIGTLRESTTDRVSLAAAGCGFYATLALFPAISTLISVYGLVFNDNGTLRMDSAAVYDGVAE